jgi:alpha-D-ribose 1-methylphosphonate 5-triphosphate synthase subunit PhnL
MNAVLSVRGLGKVFTVAETGTLIRACAGVDIDVMPGEFIGITGRSGSGKSTVLKMVYGTYLAAEGEIWYDSARYGRILLSRVGERTMIGLRRQEIGYVSQFLQAVPRTSAREIVAQSAMEAGRGREEAAENAAAMLRHFELDERLWDCFANTFSGGEKLRLNIARAMVKEPRLLLMDEPTASLDERSKERVRELMAALKARGATMLGVFHDLEFMAGLCDRSYRMENGRLEGRRT